MSSTRGPDASPPQVGPGWYPDPFAPGDQGRRRWWDGTQWGSTRRWDGVTWVEEAPALAPEPATKRRRPRLWLLVVGVVLVVLAGGCGVLLLVGTDQALTHDLIETRFSESAEPFELGSDSGAGPYTFAVKDGDYVITATANEANSTMSLGDFARVAYTVDVVTTVSGLGEGRRAGLGCTGFADAPDGYYLTVSDQGASLLRQQDGQTTTLDTAPDATVDDAEHLLELSCHQQGLRNMNAQTVTATLDGRQIMSADDATPPIDGFGYAGLQFWSLHTDDSVHWGDVTATVPE